MNKQTYKEFSEEISLLSIDAWLDFTGKGELIKSLWEAGLKPSKAIGIVKKRIREDKQKELKSFGL